jgi:hypothetical protein
VLVVKIRHYLKPLLVSVPVLMLALFVITAASLGKSSKDTTRYTPRETIHLLSSLTSKEDLAALRRVLLSQNEPWAQLTVQILDSKSPKDAAEALSKIEPSISNIMPSPTIQIVPNVAPYLTP